MDFKNVVLISLSSQGIQSLSKTLYDYVQPKDNIDNHTKEIEDLKMHFNECISKELKNMNASLLGDPLDRKLSRELSKANSLNDSGDKIFDRIHGEMLNRDRDEKVVRVVLTGGPCAGKTTAMDTISTRMDELGIDVYRVPEAATLFFKGGTKIKFDNYNIRMKFQTELIKMQICLEDIFSQIAKTTCRNKALVICDRGCMDSKAQMTKEEWLAIFNDNCWSESVLRDKRQDMIIHMVTAANGAEKQYNLGNVARDESIEKAIELDDNLITAWRGHSKLRIVDNSQKFDLKIEKVVESVKEMLNLPIDYKIYKKYIVTSDSDENGLPIIPEKQNSRKFEITDIFLKADDDNIVRMLRQRSYEGNNSQSFRTRTWITNDKFIEKKERINGAHFMQLKDNTDENKNVLHIIRQSMLHKSNIFIIDTIVMKYLSFNILRSHSQNKTDIPKFIHVVDEISGNTEFTMSNIANIDWEMPDEQGEAIRYLPKADSLDTSLKTDSFDTSLDMLEEIPIKRNKSVKRNSIESQNVYKLVESPKDLKFNKEEND